MSGRPRTTSFAEANKQQQPNLVLGGLKVGSKCNYVWKRKAAEWKFDAILKMYRYFANSVSCTRIHSAPNVHQLFAGQILVTVALRGRGVIAQCGEMGLFRVSSCKDRQDTVGLPLTFTTYSTVTHYSVGQLQMKCSAWARRGEPKKTILGWFTID